MTTKSALSVVILSVFLAYGAGRFDLRAQDHVGQYNQSDIARGAQAYATHCDTCHGPNGNNVGTVDLSRGRFRLATSDDELKRLIETGIPGAGMPALKLSAADLSAIVAFIRSGLDVGGRAVAVNVGDAVRGRAIFEGKGDCLKCHRVRGQGPAAAPDLTDIGSARTPAALQLALLDPTGAMLPLNRPVRAVLTDGRVVRGRRLNEDTYTVQLIDEQERLLTLTKTDLREYEIVKVSPMPSYQGRLTAAEMADLLAYLISLKDSYGIQNPGRGRGAGMGGCRAPAGRSGDVRASAQCGERAAQLADVFGRVLQ